MDNSELLAALERDGRAFAASCRSAAKGTRIDSCPEWDVDDLLWHMTEVHWFWRQIAETRADNPKGVSDFPRPDAAELPALYDSGLEALLRVLREADPATPVWTWAKRKDIGFIVRRMAQETAVHRWDADKAAGVGGNGRPAIEPDLASDGIDEFLDEFVNDPREGASVGGSVHIHCTDVPGEWLTKPGPDGLVTTREHAKGDAAIRGAASDLLLVLWRRIPLDDVEVIGDRTVAEQLVGYTNLE